MSDMPAYPLSLKLSLVLSLSPMLAFLQWFFGFIYRLSIIAIIMLLSVILLIAYVR